MLTLMITIYVLNLDFHYQVVHLLGFTMQLVFGSSTPVTRLNLFFGRSLDGSRFFKSCYAFEAFSRGCILLEIEMI